MTAKRTYYKDGRAIPEEEALNADGIIKDGVTLHCPVFLKDSSGNFLVDGLGQPLPAQGRRSGFVFADTDQSAQRRAERYDYAKAELSARYKGGLEAGDHVHIGDRRPEALGYNPENGKLVLADTAQLDGEACKQEAYDSFKAELSARWKTRPTTDDDQVGGACTTQSDVHGKWTRGKDGKLVCSPHKEAEPGKSEWDIAGPLSDSDVRAIDAIRMDAWLESVQELESAWKR